MASSDLVRVASDRPVHSVKRTIWDVRTYLMNTKTRTIMRRVQTNRVFIVYQTDLKRNYTCRIGVPMWLNGVVETLSTELPGWRQDT